jgi:hypothetical protein
LKKIEKKIEKRKREGMHKTQIKKKKRPKQK